MILTNAELERYSRHLSLKEVGVSGQSRLRVARVLVVGAGGLGSPALLYLAAAGVGTLGVVDGDRVDVSNLQRQVLFNSADVGMLKTEATKARLLALNPHVEVELYPYELNASNAMDVVRCYDLVLDGTDRFATRYLVSDTCVLLGKPLVTAAIHRFEGQMFTYVPHSGPCYRCLFSQPPPATAAPNCAEAGVLGVLPGVMGALQATEAIKLIARIGDSLVGRLLTYDAIELRFREAKFERRVSCAACGENATIKELHDAAPECGIASNIRVVDPVQLQELIDGSDKCPQLLLIDVREPYEFAAGHLGGAINVPLASLQQTLRDLRYGPSLVFMCRGGVRSLQACQLAISQGLEDVTNLNGGLLRWARDVETQMIVV